LLLVSWRVSDLKENDHKETPTGDIYFGRLRWLKGGLVENIDFRIPDLEVKSLWMTRAVTENLQQQALTQPEEHAKLGRVCIRDFF